MFHATARLFRKLLRLLLPAEGGHRASTETLPSPSAPTTGGPRVPALRGEDIGLVRPYLIAHERREEAQRQRRRQSLVLATSGMCLPEVPRWP